MADAQVSEWDAIVIGSGMGGMAAALSKIGNRVLLLEAHSTLGGRRNEASARLGL